MTFVLTNADGKGLHRRELYFFALFRCLEAALLAFWIYSPYTPFPDLIPQDSLRYLCVGYLASAFALLIWDRWQHRRLTALVGLILDSVIFAAVAVLLPSSFYAVAPLMLVNLAAGGLLLRAWPIASLTAFAVLVVFFHLLQTLFDASMQTDAVRALMFAVSYVATVAFCQMLAAQAALSRALAEERGQHLAEMAQMNELIISHIRTGVILLDRHHRILLSNESAGQLAQAVLSRETPLLDVAPDLDHRLMQWRNHPQFRPEAMALYKGGPVVIPHFVTVELQDLHYLIFLEDSRIFSGRADELQLANLGRLSASIAHEIRNPLAAISYAQQLMEESPDVSAPDKEMLVIIGQQCKRLNGIIENILGLARRQGAQPQNIELNSFVQAFVAEHLSTNPQDVNAISINPAPTPIYGLFDRSHLHQILTILLNNALNYGHQPHLPAEITLSVDKDGRHAIIRVNDKGPGISSDKLQQLFKPFNTTSNHGTGLGLYIAKELSDANQAGLKYNLALGGGSQFTLSLSDGQTLLARR